MPPIIRSRHQIQISRRIHRRGIDFEQRESLRACASCHFQPGVHSMLSRGRMEPGGMQRVEVIPAWDLNYEINETKWWKGRQYNWGLLQGLWRSQPEAIN